VLIDIKSLERSLGPFGFQWLAACAHLPRLDPMMTERLGLALARALRPSGTLEFDECATFYAQHWMRMGAIPDEVRDSLAAMAFPQTLAVLRELDLGPDGGGVKP